MFPLFETFKIISGKINNLEYHQERIEYSIKLFYGKSNNNIVLKKLQLPLYDNSEILRCRFNYSYERYELNLSPYIKRNIDSLKIIFDDQIMYCLKYSDRNRLNELFDLRGNCDDILICKKGLITDTSIANVVLYDGVRFVTPRNPVLKGTYRKYLLDKGVIFEKDISIDELTKYEYLILINALREFDLNDKIYIKDIK